MLQFNQNKERPIDDGECSVEYQITKKRLTKKQAETVRQRKIKTCLRMIEFYKNELDHATNYFTIWFAISMRKQYEQTLLELENGQRL